MKIIKKILIALVILVAGLLVTAIFIEKDYTLEREVTINKPKHEVYDYIRMLKNQNEFNAWYKMDPATKTEVRGNDGEVGSVYAWESEVIGTGEQKTIQLTDESIDYELHFIEPFEGKATNKVLFEALSDNQTKVRTVFYGHSPYPMNAMHLFMNMDRMVGDNLASGLNNIKSNLEKQ